MNEIVTFDSVNTMKALMTDELRLPSHIALTVNNEIFSNNQSYSYAI